MAKNLFSGLSSRNIFPISMQLVLCKTQQRINDPFAFGKVETLKKALLFFAIFLIISLFLHLSASAENQKILYIDSYHQEYMWSADITIGIKSVLAGRKDLELKIFQMDTKRNQSEDFKKAAAVNAKDLIASWNPDVVIASDDNAAKYLIVPYFMGTDLPFVFCGLNWDASAYGFPAKNVTGMVEVALFRPLLKVISKYAKGDSIGYLASDTLSERKELEHISKEFHTNFNVRLTKTFDELKQAFIDLQKTSDMVLIQECRSVKGFNHNEMVRFINANTFKPTGALQRYLIQYALITFSKIGEEQGEYAAKTALKILSGKSPREIPIVSNKKAKIYLNMKLAKKLGVKFPIDLIETAHLLSAKRKKILYVNSYHKGYDWSDDIEKGLLKALDIKTTPNGTFDTSKSEIEIKIFRMDTKLNSSEKFKKAAALSAKKIITEWLPDIVVVSDDNAVKYLVSPYYKNAEIPFVFCGLNADASDYGLPVANITGMLEVAPYLETIEMLNHFSQGRRIGIIGARNITNLKEVSKFKKIQPLKESGIKLVSSFTEWKKEYLRLQDTVDMLFWFSPIGIKGWDQNKAVKFILKNTRIPTGIISDNNACYALLGKVKVAEEQGWWAGRTALRILEGTSPAAIPVTTNQQFKLYLNMTLAKQLGLKFPIDLLEKAIFIEDFPVRKK